MAEALWLQLAGVDYSAAEDRRAISALSSPGVASNLVISAVSGLQVKVTAGAAIIDDGAGGAYVAYTTADTTLTATANTSTNIYITVNTTTAVTSVVSGSTPSGPYLLLGSVLAAAAVTSVTNTTVKAAPPGLVGLYLPLTGGTLATGASLSADRLVVPSLFGVGGVDAVPNAPKGIRLGGTSPTARAGVRVDQDVVQTIRDATWTTVNYGTLTRQVNSYGGTLFNTVNNRFTCPVAGDYAVSARIYFTNPAGPNVGTRRLAVVSRSADGSIRWMSQGPTNDSTTANLATVDMVMDCPAGSTLEIQAYQSQGASLTTLTGAYASGSKSLVNIRLIQAD